MRINGNPKFKLYYLIDPRPGKDYAIKYVGLTHRALKTRLRDHIYEAKCNHNKGHKNYWINKVVREGYNPIIELVFENMSLEDACIKEIEAISIIGRIKDGGTLTNITAGGEGNLGGGAWNKGMNLTNSPNDPRLKSMSEKLSFRKKKVYRYDLKGNLIDEWESLSALNRAMGLDYRLVSAIAKKKHGRKSLNGFTFCFEGGFPYIETSDIEIRRQKSLEKQELKNKVKEIKLESIRLSKAAAAEVRSNRLNINELKPPKIKLLKTPKVKIARPRNCAYLYGNRYRSIKVYQYDFDGKFVTEHLSILSAATAVGGTNADKLSEVLNGKYATYRGFYWKKEFMGDLIEVLKNNKKALKYAPKQKVAQYTLGGEFVAIHESSHSAAKFLNTTQSGPGNIRSVVNGKRNYAYGFVWKAA